jgi:MFS family permease
MQTVGAQWFLIHAAHAAILVALVQVADMLPDALFAIVGGVLADTLDRRRLLMAVQGGLVVATSALAALTIAGRMSCTTVRGHTFVTTSGSPFRPSQTRKNTSLTPRLRRSVSTLIQLF